jgi:arylsulfatase A-like enzyme
LLFADDLGYGDLGVYGNPTIRTPNLDRLASQGLRMTAFYSAPSCVPARTQLLLGRYPSRTNVRGTSVGGDGGIPDEYVTLAQALGAAGYRTAMAGKWHLGYARAEYLPVGKGFDSWFGLPYSNDMIKPWVQTDEPLWLYRGAERIEHPVDQDQLTLRYTAEVVDVIRESSGQPFFAYLAYSMPHLPLRTAGRFRGTSRSGLYGDVIEAIDWSAGQIVQALDETGQSDDTIVIFTSDNGPWCMFREFGGSAGPLRGEKGTGWEGGPRVPAIFSWPGRIAPGVTDAFMVNVDLYATVAAITGAEPPQGYPLDSLDLSDTLLAGAASPRTSYLFFSSGHYREPFSYRSGDYKIHVRSNDVLRDPITGADAPVTEYDPPLLYNLRQEVGERRELSGAHPDLVQRLKAEFDAAAAALDYELTAPYRKPAAAGRAG